MTHTAAAVAASAPTESWGPARVAEFLAISERHLADIRGEDRTFPQPRMLGTLPRWSPAALALWLLNEDSSGTGTAAPTEGRRRV